MNGTLLEALVASLEANATVAALYPGGIYNTTAAPTAELPFLTIKQTDSQATGVAGLNFWVDKVQISFESRALTGDAAELLSDQLRTALFVKPVSLLGWTNGGECGRWLAPGAAGELEDGLGTDGSDVWVQRLPIGFTISRTA